MTVSELIRKLEELRTEQFCHMKHLIPMGQAPDEPEIYIDKFEINNEAQVVYAGFTKDFDVLLDLTVGITIIPK